jgi:hypothetical protein
MFTNSLLGIVQQQTVEWHVRRNAQKAGGSGADIEVKIKEESASKGVDKGKKAKRDKAKPTTDSKLTQRDPLLGKGKA